MLMMQKCGFNKILALRILSQNTVSADVSRNTYELTCYFFSKGKVIFTLIWK